MQKSCMSVFKYLILTAARLKYNVEEALLLLLLKGARAERDRERGRKRERERERERGGSCSAMSERERERWSDGEWWKRGGEETRLFSMTILLPCTLSSLESEAALKHSLPTKKKKKVYNHIRQLSVFLPQEQPLFFDVIDSGTGRDTRLERKTLLLLLELSEKRYSSMTEPKPWILHARNVSREPHGPWRWVPAQREFQFLLP